MVRDSIAPSATTLSSRSSRSRQSSELFAAFNGPSDNDSLPGYSELSSSAGPSTAQSVAAHASSSAPYRPSDEVFFDAGDALPQEPQSAQPPSQSTPASIQDPLGANTSSSNNAARTPSSHRPPPLFTHSTTTPAYDFERPEYFPAPTRRPPASSPRMPSASLHPRSPGYPPASLNQNDDVPDHHALDMGFDADTSLQSNGATAASVNSSGYSRVPSFSGGSAAETFQSRTDRLRFALGRFGRFVGMGIPGARYASLTQNDGRAGPAGSHTGVHRPRVVGGGIGQDGVFANLNAKPERRRRTAADGNADDRGEDDDLEDDVQPPTYDIAAADAVPQYWETTILGGGGLHPLVNGLGWTPGGAHVGAIEDLIVEGLAVGNFFGFAWNMLVSMTFQFVGFLLTYLLHTTHAARCGSRAGLGVTLIQYGYYLKTRSSEIGEAGGPVNDPFGNPNGGANWFGEINDSTENGSRGISRRIIEIMATSTSSSSAVTSEGGTLADMFAAQADGVPLNSGGNNFTDSMSQSTEWLAYVLMVLGWFILLSSMLSYWRIHRWGKSLVDAARRDQDSGNAADGTAASAGESGSGSITSASGFVDRFRSVFRGFQRNSESGGSSSDSRTGTGEDWVIFPGLGHRLGRNNGSRRSSSSRRNRRSSNRDSASYDHPTSVADLEDEDGLDTEDADLNPTERRLLQNIRYMH